MLEATVLLKEQATTIYCDNALMQIQVANNLGEAGKEMLEATRVGLEAFAKYALIPDKNLLRPMLTDGTDLSSFAIKRFGYYGSKGRVLDPYPAGPEFMLSYARAYMLTGDAALWKMARSSARVFGLGDIGETPGKSVQVNLAADNANAYALFSVLDLYQRTHTREYLQLGRAIGNNIVKRYFHHGYFTPYEDTIFADINAIEPYALLALDAAIKGTPEKAPYFINGLDIMRAFTGLAPARRARSTRVSCSVLGSRSPIPKGCPAVPTDAQQVSQAWMTGNAIAWHGDDSSPTP